MGIFAAKNAQKVILATSLKFIIMKSQKINQYLDNLASGFMKSKNDQILNKIYLNQGITLHELRMTTNISHQTITSAISNLMDQGLIKITGKVIVNKKHYSRFKVCTDINEIEQNQKFREREKINQWIKNGLNLDLPIIIKDLIENHLINLKKENNQLTLEL